MKTMKDNGEDRPRQWDDLSGPAMVNELERGLQYQLGALVWQSRADVYRRLLSDMRTRMTELERRADDKTLTLGSTVRGEMRAEWRALSGLAGMMADELADCDARARSERMALGTVTRPRTW